jgi:5-methylcytosine-specific restriction endonuclease McrA
MSTWASLSREQKDEYNRRSRERYRNGTVLKEQHRGYQKKRRQDLQCRLQAVIYRMTLGHSARYSPLHTALMEAGTGLSREEFTARFGTPDMTLDHIIPLSAFDLTDPVQFLKAIHPSNLQILTHAENVAKGNTCPEFDMDGLVYNTNPEALKQAKYFIDKAVNKWRITLAL